LQDQWLHHIHAARPIHTVACLPDLRRSRAGPLTGVPRSRDLGETLAEQGRVVRLTTVGRISGRPTSTSVGFVEQPDGCLIIAAGTEGADWARNLAAHPTVVGAWGGREQRFRAESLDGADFASAIRTLILRYGTPAEGLGSGPAFRLRPIPDDSTTDRTTRTSTTPAGGGPVDSVPYTPEERR
jgi:deazaflavin-dependent oxidoreductase (nitroreductase family)